MNDPHDDLGLDTHYEDMLAAVIRAAGQPEVIEATQRLNLHWLASEGTLVERNLGDGRTAVVMLMTYGKGRIGVGQTEKSSSWMSFDDAF